MPKPSGCFLDNAACHSGYTSTRPQITCPTASSKSAILAQSLPLSGMYCTSHRIDWCRYLDREKDKMKEEGGVGGGRGG